MKGDPSFRPGGHPSLPNQSKSHFRDRGTFKVINDVPRNALRK